MFTQALPPRASSLTESMRDIGYSFEAAVADIIDNSIAADATEVNIRFDFESEEPKLCIIDNGKGMSRDELIESMRHGSTHPRTERAANDLGRFGLGLKTASFSQCRRLVVVSSQDEQLSAAVWDLDIIAAHDSWVLCILEASEIQQLPYVAELGASGTMVIWEKMDRLCENPLSDKKVLYEKIELVDRHLAMVFHRYISGEIKVRRLEIKMNHHIVEAFDPFCISNKATQLLPEEICRIRGHEVRIQPYILPHHSKLSPRELDYYQTRSEFVGNQGVYVYRNNRLMIWGSWFRLVPKGEATKLARVRIDFPNALDDMWTIDIKKSRAFPPQVVKDKLRQILNRITEHSTRVHAGRGSKLFDENPVPCWTRHASHGGISYSINRTHPIATSFQQILEPDHQRLFQEVLSVIEETIPIEAIYSDYSMTPKSFDEPHVFDATDIAKRLRLLFDILSGERELDANSFRMIVSSVKPFMAYPAEIDKFLKEQFHE